MGPPISVSRPFRQSQNLVGGYPYVKPSNGDVFGLRNPRWHPSVVILLLFDDTQRSTSAMHKYFRIGPKRPTAVPKPLWIPPTGLNPPSMTNDVPMERFGPREAQHTGLHGFQILGNLRKLILFLEKEPKNVGKREKEGKGEEKRGETGENGGKRGKLGPVCCLPWFV